MNEQNFFEQFSHGVSSELPKYAQMREILIAAIAAGHWKQGEQLPNENALTKMTPFSLGTIQRALRSLSEGGMLERRQGSGSFVARSSRLLPYPLHCRFLNEARDGFLPIFSTTLRRGLVKGGEGPWVGAIDATAGSIVQIDRRIDVNHEFVVYSRFFATKRDLGSLLKCPLRKLDGQPFRLVIAEEMKLPVTSIRNHVRAQMLPDSAAAVIGVERGTAGLYLKAIAASASRTVYVQDYFIPPTERFLVVSAREDNGASPR